MVPLPFYGKVDICSLFKLYFPYRQSQSEIETKVASFRSLLLRQLTTLNNNKVRSVNIHQTEDETGVEAEDDTEEEREEEREGIR